MMVIIHVIFTVFAIIGVLALIVFGYDAWVRFNTWQSRIHIGRLRDAEWADAVADKATQWLYRCPVVPKKDESRLLLLDKFCGKHRNNTIQSWQTAGLLLGMVAVGRTVKADELSKIIKKYQDTRHVDRALLSYALLLSCPTSLDCRAEVMEFAKDTADLLLEIKGNQATIPYRRERPSIRYVDTIGLICPFLVEYGLSSGNMNLVVLAMDQIIEYSRFLHHDLKFPPHSYDIEHGAPIGLYDWGRGVGWYILGLTESKHSLERHNCRGEEYKKITSLILEISMALLPFQKSDGGFARFITENGGQYESSATVLSGLALIDAYEISRNKVYLEAACRALQVLQTVTKRNGAIDLCQGDTKGIGIYSASLIQMPFVEGLALSLYSRYVKNA